MLSEVLSQHGSPESKNTFAASLQRCRRPATPQLASSPYVGATVPGVEAWLANLGLESYADAVNSWADDMGAASLAELADELPSLQNVLPLKPLEVKRLEKQGADLARRICAEVERVGRVSGTFSAEAVLLTTSADLWDAAPPRVSERTPLWITHESQSQDGISTSQSFEVAAKLAERHGILGASSLSAKGDQAVRTISSRGVPRSGKLSSTSAPSTIRDRIIPRSIVNDREGIGESNKNYTHELADGSRVLLSNRSDLQEHSHAIRRNPDESLDLHGRSLENETSLAKGVRIHKAAKGGGKEGHALEQGRVGNKGKGKYFREQGQFKSMTPDPWHIASADTWNECKDPHSSKSERSSSSSGPKTAFVSRSVDTWNSENDLTANDPWHTTGADPWKSSQQSACSKPASQSRQAADPLSAHGADPWARKSRSNDGVSNKGKGRVNQTSSSSDGGCRTVALQVDAATGAAGLDVLWLSGEGYLIEGIDNRPGQPGLRVGEVIRAIGGVRLDDARSEREIERRFESAFCNGVALEVVGVRCEKGDGVVGKTCNTTVKDSPRLESEFTTTLHVREKGAGLSLVWHRPEGYFVEDIETIPGQPGLRCGDVIRMVGETKLYGYNSEWEADSALSHALTDGIQARVFRPLTHCRQGDILLLRTAREASGGTPFWISSLGIGTWSWGNDRWGHGTWGTPSGAWAQEEALSATFRGALDAGVFFFDTAPTYGRGFAEHSLGSFCSGGPHAVVATKYFPRPNDRDLEAAMIKSAEATISRLKLDRPLDLFQLHKPADPPTSLEQQADALAAVVHKGFASAVGVCNFSLEDLRIVYDRLRRTHKIPLSTCQIEFSLLHQLPMASGLISACHNMGVAILAYSPLGMGRLSSKHDPLRGPPLAFGRNGDSQRPFGATLDNDPAALDTLLKALKSIGQKYGGRSVTQVALNWVLCQGAVALAGARTEAQAYENAGAMGWRLSKEDVDALAALGARGMPPNFQQ